MRGMEDMTVFLLFNELYRDGMGTAALTLFRALKAQGFRVQPIHAWNDIKFPEYVEAAHPIFAPCGEYGVDAAHVRKLAETVNAVARPGDVAIDFGSGNWLCAVPYLKPGLRIVTAVHSINPSTLKLGRAYPDRVSTFVCISKGVRDRFLRKLPKRYHGKVHLVPNAVDAAPAPKADWSNDGTLRILYVGRIENTSKGCAKIPPMLRLLRARGVRVRLDLYGYFHNWERQWWAAVDRAGVRDLVSYKGEIAHADVFPTMARYDVFLAPSNFEGFPLSISEAMSCALPVVASRIPGVTDWICPDGECGRIVPKSDVRAFADALAELAADEGKRRAFGLAGRARITTLASFEAHGRGYAEIVREAVRERPASDAAPQPVPDDFRQPEFLKPWGPARLLPTGLKEFLRRFMR